MRAKAPGGRPSPSSGASGMSASPLLLRRHKLGQRHRPEIAHIGADVELPRQGLQPAMAVAMQVDTAAIYPLPAAERVMAKDGIDPIEFQFGIIHDDFPTPLLAQRVRVSDVQWVP